MSDYYPARKSQIQLIRKTRLYTLSKDGEAVLYKDEDQTVDKKRLKEDNFPPLYIHKSDRDALVKELQTIFNYNLARAVATKGLARIKSALCQIVEESLHRPSDAGFESLPETIELLFSGYSENRKLLDSLVSMSAKSPVIVEHTVNVLALAMQYCFYNDFSEADTKKLGVCAIVHDVGCTQIDSMIIETDERLTDEQYEIYKAHPMLGYKIIRRNTGFDGSIAKTVLNHHEKLDGSGYPKGLTVLTDEAQLIGLIDSYEPLTYRGKTFRDPSRPFDTLQLLKNDVIKGRYDKSLFIHFCSSLTR